MCSFVALLLYWLFTCTFPGWRDNKDHESLHKHDCKEAVQREVCVQLWKQLDQVIDCTGHRGNVHLNYNEQERREDVMRRGTTYFDRDDVSDLLTGYVAKQTNSIQKYSFLKTLKLWYVWGKSFWVFFASFHAVSKPVTAPNYTGHLSLLTWNLIQVFFSGFYFLSPERACSTKSIE